MRNFVIWSVVLLAMAGNAFSEGPKQPAKELAVELGGGVKLEMVLIPAGEFLMGSPDSDKGARDDETPQHRVRITRPFYLGKYLVTQEQWEAVMGSNPSRFKGPKNPVEMISWDHCQVFLGKLNAKTGGQRGKFVLPTEAQWEYACRAGSTTKYCFGDDEPQLENYAWYKANAGNATHPVGKKKPNAWGLYDMHGNVWEWCQDWDDEGYYVISPADDPAGPSGGSNRVIRGGSWSYAARNCRSAFRNAGRPQGRDNSLGLRVCQVPAGPVVETPLPKSPGLKIQPISPRTVEVGKLLAVLVSVEDARRWQGKLRYSLASKALPGAKIDPAKGEFSWMPPPDYAAGTEDVAVSVEGPDGQRDQKSFRITVTRPSSSEQKETAVDLGNGVKLEMVLVHAGEFLMGSPDSNRDAQGDEKPQHRIRITKPFYLGKYLVTQEQWEAVMGNNPSNFKGPKNPVEQVSWDDCHQFLDKLNGRQGNQAGKFQLPSEAQWEYACRAGSTTKYYFGDDESALGEYAWCRVNSGSPSTTHPVGEKKPNAWGLYDMHGNVWEWCADWYAGGQYAKSPTDDPAGPEAGSFRAIRGGCWGNYAGHCRSAYRNSSALGSRDYSLGFRVARVPADK